MYLTYYEYISMGGTLDDSAYMNYYYRAKARIDWVTFNRLDNFTEFPEELKRCVYRLIELYQNRDLASNLDLTSDSASVGASGIIKEQSNDGVSVVYNTMTAGDTVQLMNSEIDDTIRMYLSNVRDSLGRKITYKGLYKGE